MTKEVYCHKCGLKFWTPKGEKEIGCCPFCGLNYSTKNNMADNLRVPDKAVIRAVELNREINCKE
ncbi:hypothetical protein [Sporohalobacter salinus]|uniref:hypothetical protein n=1 Tax=Sporohalobacter salinus TaxID=1494606 RepID=UPI00195FA966|nr:hypothetical protein [Sporohalobacter salinus]MBM7623690.1 hypothetical protein [Sporohalobacter salinus]